MKVLGLLCDSQSQNLQLPHPFSIAALHRLSINEATQRIHGKGTTRCAPYQVSVLEGPRLGSIHSLHPLGSGITITNGT